MRPPGKEKYPVYFILALHNHQPVGNLPEVFSRTYEEAYLPFLKSLHKHPTLKAVLHYTGILLEWIEKNDPSFFVLLRDMIERGQVEMMGGAYYEPILPIIPDEDKWGQIKKLSRYLNRKLSVEAKGMWLAERIWEPHLAKPLGQAGIRYVVVDDAHFQELGKKSEELTGYFLTEEEGYPLRIFPISEKLRYLIPFESIDQTIDYFSSLGKLRGRNSLAVLADDGEKFGGWPGTHEHVYQNGWLEDFFGALEENESWLKTTTFREYMEKCPPLDRVYLPAAAYREMKEWSGGFWRNFLVRYPESNRMHKKMLAVRKKVPFVADLKNRRKVKDLLWAAQCNCAYWHGVFGGLYLNFLRSAVYENLIKAENIIAREMYPSSRWLEVKIEDRNYDGRQDIIVNNEYLALLFSPSLGGSLWELSFRPAAANLLDTITRRPEDYHRELVESSSKNSRHEERTRESGEGVKTIHHGCPPKEEGLEKHIIYDSYPRGALLEHFLSPAARLEEFCRGEFAREGDFLLQPCSTLIRRLNEKAELRFTRRGALRNGSRVLLQKNIITGASSPGFKVDYRLLNEGSGASRFRFGVELNLAFLSGSAPDRYYHIPQRELDEKHLASYGEEQEVEILKIIDEWRKIELSIRFSPPALLWRYPLETVSRSEEGLERVYQQSVILPLWDLQVEPGAEFLPSIHLDINT